MNKEIIINLLEPIEYQSRKKGKIEIAKTLILKAPNRKQRSQAIKLTQGAFQALKSFQNQNSSLNSKLNSSASDINTEEPNGTQYLGMLYMSDLDMVDYHNTFKELLLHETCFLENEEKLTEALYEKLSLADLDIILGEYLVNFLLSLLKSMMAQ